MMQKPVFFELGARTNYSFLQGAAPAEEMVVYAKRIGLGGLGIADRNTVAGVVRAHNKAKYEKYPFQPGARLSFVDGTPDILAYPRNRRGWGHLCRLLSAGNLRSVKGECTLMLADLLKWQAELQLIVMPNREGPISVEPRPVKPGEGKEMPDEDKAAPGDLKNLLHLLRSACGDRLYLALAPRYDGFDRHGFESLAIIAHQTGVRLLATNDALYHDPRYRPLADVVTAIREHVTIAHAGFRLQANAERHLKPATEMARIFNAYPDAVANAASFFKLLSFNLDELKHQYPNEAEEGETAAETLARCVREGAALRYPTGVPEKIEKQLAYELALIHRKEYEPYFLTVYKLVKFARSRNILCQGRGSAANSSVCYCLGITEVDPLEVKLLFDRFLSEDRDEPPDIDVDFEHGRRQEVIEHIYETYTKEHAGIAAAVISYRARSAGREVAKTFGLSEDVQSALSSLFWGWCLTSFSEVLAYAAGFDI